jgi:type IV pilus assembly protein PilQ
MTHKICITLLLLVLGLASNSLNAAEISKPPVSQVENSSQISAINTSIVVQKITFENNAVQVVTNGKLNSFSSFRLNKPARLVIDLPGVVNQLSTQDILAPSPFSSIKTVQYNDKLRLIIEASQNSMLPDAQIDSNQNGLVINFSEKSSPKNLQAMTSYTPPEYQSKNIVSTSKFGAGGARGHITSVAIDYKPGTTKISVDISGSCSFSDPQEVLNGILVSFDGCIVPANWQGTIDTAKDNPILNAVTLFATDTSKKIEAGMLIDLQQRVKYSFSKDKQRFIIDLDTTGVAAAAKSVPKSGSTLPKANVLNSMSLSSVVKDPKVDSKKFTGKKMSMEFDNAELRQIFRILSEVSGDNIIIGDDIKGNYTIKLKDVPWDQALEMILVNNNLEVARYGNVIEVITYDKIKKRRDQTLERQKQLFEQKLAEERMKTVGAAVDNKSDEIVTARCQVNNTTAADILPVLKILLSKYQAILGSTATINTTKTNANVTSQSGGVLGGGGLSGEATFDKNTSFQSQSTYKAEYGEMYPEPNTNTIIINDRKDVIRKAESIISILDVPKKQVMIEARMVEASTTFVKEMGVQWGAHLRDGSASFLGINSLDTGFGGLASAPVTSGTSGPGMSTGISFGTLASNIQLDARLSASATMGTVKIISNPKVVTTYGNAAKITQGQKIPYTIPATGNTPATTNFITAALVLDVTPRITPSGGVLIDLTISNDSSTGIGTPPSINTKVTTTQMTIQDNETAVIGGIYTNNDTGSDQGVPYLMDIPLLGNLFKSKVTNKSQSEMLIFLTPRLLDKEKQTPTKRTECVIIE